MFCEKCGNNLLDKANFCNKCGYHISDIGIPEDNNQLEQNKKANKRNLRVVLIVLAVIILPVIGISIYDEMTKSPDSNANSVQSTSKDNPETWKEFNSVEGNFKILFPKDPIGTTKYLDVKGATDKPKMQIYTSEQNGEIAYLTMYVIYYGEYDFSDRKGTLEKSLNGSLAGFGNSKIISSSFSKFLNHDAIDYSLYSSQDDIYYKGKNFISGNTLYALLITYRQKQSSNIQADKFFNSFQLNPKPTTQTNDNLQQATDEVDPVVKADYQDGYKSGYVDGRSSYGQLGDNYAEPATEERKSSYFVGYLNGFLKGCREGNFDCSKVEDAINSLDQAAPTDVNFIPPSIN